MKSSGYTLLVLEPLFDPETDDASLARRIAEAAPEIDAAAENALIRRLSPRVRLYGMKHLRDQQAADDLAQRVILETLQSLRAGRLREPDRVISFVLGTCRQMVIDQRRTHQRRAKILDTFRADVPNGSGESPPQLLESPGASGSDQPPASGRLAGSDQPPASAWPAGQDQPPASARLAGQDQPPASARLAGSDRPSASARLSGQDWGQGSARPIHSTGHVGHSESLEPRLQPCLEKLPERERSILLLTFYAERPAKEIAGQFAISEGNVRVIRHRGLARLRDCINREARTV